MGTERRHNESLVMFLLRHRRADRYSSDIKRGHPLYERIRAEVLAELSCDQQSDDEVLESLNAKLDDARERMEKRLAHGDKLITAP